MFLSGQGSGSIHNVQRTWPPATFWYGNVSRAVHRHSTQCCPSIMFMSFTRRASSQVNPSKFGPRVCCRKQARGRSTPGPEYAN